MKTHQRTNQMKCPLIRLSITIFPIDFMLTKLWVFKNVNPFSRDCPTGYSKNEETGKCEDIDECEERIDVTCNIDTQVCLNTPGSYQCLDITPLSSACPNGFKFDQKIKQCIGNEHWTNIFLSALPWDNFFIHFIDIDECELGIGICPPKKECKNIPGGYDCIDSKLNSIQYVNRNWKFYCLSNSLPKW